MVDPKRHINILSEEDQLFLNECEEEFKDRFTERDDEFQAYCAQQARQPPVLEPWQQRNNFGDYRGGGGGGGRGRFNDRGRYHHHHNNRNRDYRDRGPYDGQYNRNRYNNNHHQRDNRDRDNRDNRNNRFNANPDRRY